jgi:uncharacterized protein (DUF433 family)
MTQARGAGEIYPGVTVNPRVMHGKPVMTGTRVPVTLVLGQLAGGEAVEAVCQNYELTAEQVRAALGYAHDVIASETVYALPTPKDNGAFTADMEPPVGKGESATDSNQSGIAVGDKLGEESGRGKQGR